MWSSTYYFEVTVYQILLCPFGKFRKLFAAYCLEVIVVVVVVWIFQRYQAPEAHRGSGDCYVHVFVQPCFH